MEIKTAQVATSDEPKRIEFGGTVYWRHRAKNHRLDGPAVIARGGMEAWYRYGKNHRLNGPAISFPDGRTFWFVDGQHYSDELTYWMAVAEWKKSNE